MTVLLDAQEGTTRYYTYLRVTNIDNEMYTMETFLEKDGDISVCPVRSVLDRIGDKWSILVMLVLGKQDTMRFNEVQKEIGDISQKMLTVTLRSLEADGLVKRTIFAEVPPRVEYAITPLGESLLPHVVALSDWAINNMPAIKKSRKRFETSKAMA